MRLVLGDLIRRVVGFKGALEFDISKPDGTPRKLLDVSKMKKLGWYPTLSLEQGVTSVYRDFSASEATLITRGLIQS